MVVRIAAEEEGQLVAVVDPRANFGASLGDQLATGGPELSGFDLEATNAEEPS